MNRYELILSKGFPTGSRVMGGWTEKSDWDYVILASDWPYEIQNCDDYEVNSIKELHEGKIINIIIVDTIKELNAWKYATQEVSNLDEKYVKEKPMRIKLFEINKKQFENMI